MGSLARTIAAPASLTLMYSELMLKDVTPQMFARLAAPGGKAVQSNHPCWVFGHCGMNFQRIMDLLGKPRGVTENPKGWEDLFKAGTTCQDDATGTVYPPMKAVTDHYFNGFRAALAAIQEANDAVFDEPNPGEGRMKDMFPTKGGLIAFLMAAHPMSHMGQASAWRRMQGLASAM